MRRVQITGLGAHLPARVVPSAEVEARCGLPAGWAAARGGVRERRWVGPGETASAMGAAAATAALAMAGLDPSDLDLVLGASGTQEQAIPDGAALVHRALGLGGSGVPAFSVHATCLSALVALDLAATLVAAGRHRRVLVVSADVASVGLNFAEPESAVLMGDAAAAVVVEPAPEGSASAVHASAFATFSEGAHLTEIRGGGTARPPHAPHTAPEDHLFHMDGAGVLRQSRTRVGPFLDGLRPGLATGLPDVDLVVPHQSSAMGLRLMEGLGWPADRIVWTLPWTGNCVAAGLPFALHHAHATGRLRRGDRVLLVGTGAGLSLGGLLLTF